jgi:hypothetical protein
VKQSRRVGNNHSIDGIDYKSRVRSPTIWKIYGGYDQGHLFSVAQGEHAYEELWMHVFYHDRRDAAEFV